MAMMDKNKGIFVTIIVYTLFLLDIFNFLVDREYGLTFANSISVYGKILVSIISFWAILSSKAYLKTLILLGLLVLFPIISCFFSYSFSELEYSKIYILVRESFKYVFAIFIFLWLKILNMKWAQLMFGFELVYYICTFIVLFAFVFDIDYFLTYNKNRFGFKPPFAAQNEITLFWMIGLTYFGDLFFNIKSRVNLLKFITVFLSALILGTKAMYGFVLCYIMFVSLFYLRFSVQRSMFIAFGAGIVTCVMFYFTGIFVFFRNIFIERGFLSSITSTRSDLFEEYFYSLIANWKSWNYFFGGLYVKIPLVEMDIVDLFLFFGIIGTLLYFYLIRKTLFNFNLTNSIGSFFVLMFFLIGALAGHILPSGLNAFYLALFCYYLQGNRSSIA